MNKKYKCIDCFKKFEAYEEGCGHVETEVCQECANKRYREIMNM